MSYRDFVEERTLEEAKFAIDKGATIRIIAKQFGTSKSTVYKDLTERLPQINPKIAGEVREVLDKNKENGPKNGGKATKLKYEKLRAITGRYTR